MCVEVRDTVTWSYLETGCVWKLFRDGVRAFIQRHVWKVFRYKMCLEVIQTQDVCGSYFETRCVWKLFREMWVKLCRGMVCESYLETGYLRKLFKNVCVDVMQGQGVCRG